MLEKQQRHIIDIFFVIALFCLFALSAIFLISIGADIYGKTVTNMEDNFNTRTALAYITEKVRQSDKDGQISVDLTGKAAGRGAYVCPTEECLKKAVKTRALERAFSQKIEPEVFDRLAAQVEHSKTEPQNSAEEKREAVPDLPNSSANNKEG